jgi:hypothetical protein
MGETMNFTLELHALGFTSTLADRIAAKVRVSDSGCHEWTGSRLPRGYGRVGRGQKHRGVELAHRAVWMIHHGPISDGLVVRHTCDNPPCCNIEHLEIGTASDNLRDMQERGRANYLRGEKHRWSKLTDEQVAEIRTIAPVLNNNAALGRRYGVTGECIRTIRHGLKRTA